MNDPIDLSGWTFDEIAAKYGEEAAIQAGIAADPDTWELTEEDFARMRPASEAHPESVEAWRASRGSQVSQTPPVKNQLYFGDNLGILRNHVADASVDLIYLDPPFFSQGMISGRHWRYSNGCRPITPINQGESRYPLSNNQALATLDSRASRDVSSALIRRVSASSFPCSFSSRFDNLSARFLRW